MKQPHKLLFIVTFSFLSTQVFSQYFAVKGGLNLSNVYEEYDGSIKSSDYLNRAGFHIGPMAGIGFGPIAVEGGVLVASKGYNFETTNSNTITARNYNLIYIDVPVNLKLRLKLGGVGIFGTVGPIFSFGVGGKITEEITINDNDPTTTRDKIKWGTSAEDNLKRNDIGLSFGGGLDIGKISLGATYNLGLSNIAATTDNDEVFKNNVLQFSIGIKIFDL